MSFTLGPVSAFGARVRCEYPRLRDTAIALAQRFNPDTVLIEDASTGSALAQDLEQVLRHPVKLVPIDRDKKGRLYVQQAKFEAGARAVPAAPHSCRSWKLSC